jgi:hypothetical protein
MVNSGGHVRDIARAWRTLRQLSRKDRQTLATAWLLLPVIGAALRLAGIRRTLSAVQRLAPLPPLPAGPEPDPAALRRLPLLVQSAARWTPVRTTCLTRSLSLCWLLRRGGIPAELRIGVRLAGKQRQTGADASPSPLGAHAWVEYRGAIVADDPHVAAEYSAFEPMKFPDNAPG